MCGIVGAVTRSKERVELTPALDALRHRGPDGVGEFHLDGISLGHRRLSIIDLSTDAAQPMSIEGCGTIVFNGEIYDHEAHRRNLERAGLTFRTRSDTEVLLRGLAKEGPGFLRELHGMYAFAWLEPTGRRLFLVRDHAGMKPLYMWSGSSTLAFASEVRALATVVRGLGQSVRTSASALGSFLAWGSVPEPMTVLKDVEMVPADCAIEIDVAECRVVGAVDIRRRPPRNGQCDAPAVLSRTRSTIGDAVRRHLVADRPVALFLSGGIDSSVLAVEMAKAGTPCAITVVLESRGTHDETALATSLAHRLGIHLECVPVSDWRRKLDAAFDAYDQPSIDGLNTFLVAEVAKGLGYRVAVSGIGADEVFGGYAHLRGWRSRLPDVPLGPIARVVGELLEQSDRAEVRRIGLLMEGASSGLRPQLGWRRVFSDSEVAALLPGSSVIEPAGPKDPLELEQTTYLRDTLLRDTDVMGMANSVEIRAPYLDPAVLQLAASIGTKTLLQRDKPPKWLLREAWREELGPSLLRRRKTGFTLDLAGWLKKEGAERLEVAQQTLLRSPFVNRQGLKQKWAPWMEKLESGHPAAWVPLFAMLQLATQLTRWGEPH